MDKIASSYIAWPDLIIVGGAIVLYWCLKTWPPNSLMTRVFAVISGFGMVSIMMVIPLADNLTKNGIDLLWGIGICLANGLFQWNRARTKLTSASQPVIHA